MKYSLRIWDVMPSLFTERSVNTNLLYKIHGKKNLLTVDVEFPTDGFGDFLVAFFLGCRFAVPPTKLVR